MPRDALILRDARTYVMRVTAENTAEPVDVAAGAARDARVEVRGELHAGDRVVVRGAERLQPGSGCQRGRIRLASRRLPAAAPLRMALLSFAPASRRRFACASSANANGIRSAASKGFLDWFRRQDADVLCLQETKAQEAQLSDRPSVRTATTVSTATPSPRRVTAAWRSVAARAGRGAHQPRLGALRRRGRYIEARFGKLSVVSLYVPSGSSGEERQEFKFRVMERLTPIFRAWLASGRDYVLCGDWNIVRARNDIKNWTLNQKNSGLPAG